MGRKCGYLALVSGIAGGAEMVLIPEIQVRPEEVAQVVESAYLKGKSHCIIVVAEGWRPGTEELARQLNAKKAELGFSVRVTRLGYVQRGGAPSAFDRVLATRLGAAAVQSLIAGKSGHMVGWVKNATQLCQLEKAISTPREIETELWELARVMEQ